MIQPKAERVVDLTLAKELIESQFPNLAPAQIEFLGEGWDNFAFCVNNLYTFRFPRRESAIESLEMEFLSLPELARVLPIAIPEPMFKGQPSNSYPWPFGGYRFVDGTIAPSAALNKVERGQMAVPLADFLKCLHATSFRIALPTEEINPNQMLERTKERLGLIEDLGLLDCVGGLHENLELVKDTRDDGTRVLVHGDLYVSHPLVNSNRQFCGVIDWSDLHHGNPAIDLAIAHSFLPPSARQLFFQRYGNVDENTQQLAYLYALYKMSANLLHANQTQDLALSNESAQELSWMAEPFRI